MIHLWTYSSALSGRHAFEHGMPSEDSMPYAWLLEAGLVWLPLAFHALYGIAISLEARPNLKSYPFARNWGYVWQRATGLIALLFIGYHAYQFPIQIALGKLQPQDVFSELCGSLSSTSSTGIPLVAVAYLVGVAATCYHFASGLTSFCFSWGITTSRRANRRVAGLSGLVAIVLFALGASSILYFATGSRLVLIWPPPSGAPPIGCGDASGEQAALPATSPTEVVSAYLGATHAETRQ